MIPPGHCERPKGARQSDSRASRPEAAAGGSKDLFAPPRDPSLCSGQCAALDCFGRFTPSQWHCDAASKGQRLEPAPFLSKIPVAPGIRG